MIKVRLSGVSIKALKSLRNQDFESKAQMEMDVVIKQKIKSDSKTTSLIINDSGLYDVILNVSEQLKDFGYDLFVAWVLNSIVNNTISDSFKIGNKSVVREIKEEIHLLNLENLKEEEEVKRLELKVKKMLLEAELKNLNDKK